MRRNMQLQSRKPLMLKLKVSGYTLIEILVGLTIVGLLFGFGFVSFRDFSRRQALGGAAKIIQGDLRLAQQQALSGKKPNDAKCNSPNSLNAFSFQVNSVSQYTINADCTGGLVQVKTTNLAGGIMLSTPSPNPVKFKVLGQGTNIPGGSSVALTLTQAGTANIFTVTISSSGEIK